MNVTKINLPVNNAPKIRKHGMKPQNYINPSEKKEKQQQIIKTSVFAAGLLATGALTGILLYKKLPDITKKVNNVSKKIKDSVMTQKTKAKIKPPISEPVQKIIEETETKTLKNGVICTVQTKKNELLGSEIIYSLSSPVNGVSKIHCQKAHNNQMFSTVSFDEAGKVLKSVDYGNRVYLPTDYKFVTEIEDSKGITNIIQNFSKDYKRIKSIVIERPDGTVKKTNIPVPKGYITEKLKDATRQVSSFFV